MTFVMCGFVATSKWEDLSAAAVKRSEKG